MPINILDRISAGAEVAIPEIEGFKQDYFIHCMILLAL
jgi:hypothetical protein